MKKLFIGLAAGLLSALIGLVLAYLVGVVVIAVHTKEFLPTVLASVTLAATDPELRKAKTQNKRMISLAVKQVAHFLGNTPAVARASYIDPRVFDRFREGFTIEPVLIDLARDPDIGQPVIQGRVEEAVLELINESRRSKLVEKAA